MSNYGQSFTADMLKKYIDTQKNYVFSYPAGSGKTTAIKNYLKDNLVNPRKIIYVAPTKSLLDDMYITLLNAGIDKKLLFNYHSSSEDILNLRRLTAISNSNIDASINLKIQSAKIILITHERMMFESINRFIGINEQMHPENRPLVFIDEAVRPCIVAKLSSEMLKLYLQGSGVVPFGVEYTPGIEYVNGVPTEHEYANINNIRKLHIFFINPGYKMKNGNYRILRPVDRSIELSDSCGFNEDADKYNEIIANRLINLYYMIASQIITGAYMIMDNQCYMNIPIALQMIWKRLAQTIVMDATADVSPSLYDGYEIVSGKELWNWDKVNQYVMHSMNFTKTKFLNLGSSTFINILSKIPIRNYNKIYLVTYATESWISSLYQYLKSEYSDYEIQYDESGTNNHEDRSCLMENDIDYSTDEYFRDINKDASSDGHKYIYLVNYGKTRGSNVFRDCDCVIQLGTYRVPVDIMALIKIIYPGDDIQNELPLANYIQELYRGRIRCGKEMDSYTVMDEDLYKYIRLKYPYINLINYNESVDVAAYIGADGNPSDVATVRASQIPIINKLKEYIDKDKLELVPFDRLMADLGFSDRANLVRSISRLSKLEGIGKYIDLVYLESEWGKGKPLKLNV